MTVSNRRFQKWATSEGYDTAPAVSPVATRIYADRSTQAAFDAYNRGAGDTARMVTEATLDTPALRQKLMDLACSK